ncbi:hypothetical protein PV10_00584 [Exophiala mesophila]|uniref:SMODS and SLOG-associating 2TM effector domain-containing protein n=1 Tax=Exophiala mesophila TaxID=212818 RepID=A0A0D2ACT5_EXOME|nr:uncharacterized protein PV10_00584 [Exophiala mesophila]KIV96763.1 hypothetical protein PV10_00584 [Exophiala mesophila]
MPSNEQTPLLWGYADTADSFSPSLHSQFCMLVGCPSSSPDIKPKNPKVRIPDFTPPPKSLYGRATRQLRAQKLKYYSTAALSNALLLSQVILGAALTGLGASESSHILITVFGAMNTIIAGIVAYLKSQGQPMRARMYRDDLDRVVDEIENSEVMWLGIAKNVHGYDEIDTDDHRVTVRSEVARLTRLYDRAVRNNTLNNPDLYLAGSNGFDGSGGQALRSRPANSHPVVIGGPVPITLPVASGPSPGADAPQVPAAAGAVPVQPAHDPDESPASAPPKPKPKDKDEEDAKPATPVETPPTTDKADPRGDASNPTAESEQSGTASGNGDKKDTPDPPPNATPPHDPDASPASDPNVPLRKTESRK